MSFEIKIDCILLQFAHISLVAVVERLFETVGVEFDDDFVIVVVRQQFVVHADRFRWKLRGWIA